MSDPTLAHDLLSAPLLTIATGGQHRAVDLPTLLALLDDAATPDDFQLVALQTHQQHAVHAFLVQLAALAQVRGGAPPQPGADGWRRALLTLAAGEAAAFHLLVEDLARPAFLQPPVPEGSLDGFQAPQPTPDSLDLLISAKNHDVKSVRFQDRAVRPEHWAYALIALQTMEGFSGRGNYGIARMNGGFASRPCVALAPSLAWGPRFRRDLALALEHRAQLLARGEDFDDNGPCLLWCLPWRGARDEALAPLALDPLFIEICRRYRLVCHNDGLAVRFVPTDAARLDAKILLGNLGDPWTPIRVKDNAALTVSASGFRYALLARLLFAGDEYEPAPAQLPRPADGASPVAVSRVLVRGQGKTGGYHERLLPVPESVVPRLGRRAERLRLGELAQQRVERVKDVQSKALRPAICALLQGGADDLDFRDPRARPWLDRFDDEVDVCFFAHLFRDIDASEDEQHQRWETVLKELATATFQQAIAEAPRPAARHYRAVSGAERRFHGGLRKVLAAAYADAPMTADPSQEGAQP